MLVLKIRPNYVVLNGTTIERPPRVPPEAWKEQWFKFADERGSNTWWIDASN